MAHAADRAKTETGAIMITPLPGMTATKPNSATRPSSGVKGAPQDPNTADDVGVV